MAWQQSGRIVGVDSLLHRRRLDEVVEPLTNWGRQIGLRVTGVALAKQRLAVQIGKLDDVVVDDRQPADARPGQRREPALPMPPAPTTATLAAFSLLLPAPPTCGRTMCRA